MKRFLRGYLKSDGIFIIKMLSRNTSSLFISDLTQNLFDFYIQKSKVIVGSGDEAMKPTPNNSNDRNRSEKCTDCFALHNLDRGDSPPALPPKAMTLKPTRDIPQQRNYIPIPVPSPPPHDNFYLRDNGCSGLTLGRDSEGGTMMMQRRLTSSQELTLNENKIGVNYSINERRTVDDSQLMNIMPPNYSMSPTSNKGP